MSRSRIWGYDLFFTAASTVANRVNVINNNQNGVVKQRRLEEEGRWFSDSLRSEARGAVKGLLL